MRHAAPAAPSAAAVRAAVAARRAALVTLLVLSALLGMSLDSRPARGAEPPPPASAVPDPASEGQQDTSETEQSPPGRTERAGRTQRVEPLTGPGPSAGREQDARTGRATSARAPRAPGDTCCVVLRC
ncbi:hypothetical protein [Streptomyces sp. AK02-01A]|uniref:hypothetical protein n=1 Tax=Streptomyces sp. AK02-01A TaxID=3028648 RepID=UPI0029B8D29A|nr:hypothetical protein [Streptomyces sp. AK02-01A]MDX3854270.1 hypothetical protein [Streptomyces sp. AK02-01A]